MLDGEGQGLDEPGLLLLGLEEGSAGLGMEVSHTASSTPAEHHK
jgi:hypothetical protein